jgi:hypothetical protein
MRAYGRMIRSEVARDTGEAEDELRKNLGCAHRHRDRLAESLLRMSAEDPTEWSLRGELLVHLDRLLDQLRVEHRTNARAGWPERRPSQRGPGSGRGRPERPARGAPRSARRARAAVRGRSPEGSRNGGGGGGRDAAWVLRGSGRGAARSARRARASARALARASVRGRSREGSRNVRRDGGRDAARALRGSGRSHRRDHHR